MNKSNFLNRFFLLVIAALMIASIPNVTALAALVHCRTDPLFLLSNGDKITVTFNPMRNGDNGGMFVNGKMGSGKVLTMSGGQGGGQQGRGGFGGQGGQGGPPAKPLTAEEVGLIRAWIDQGAK